MRNGSIFFRLIAFVLDMLLVAFFAGLMMFAMITGYSLSRGSFQSFGSFPLVILFLCASLGVFLFYFTYLTIDGSSTVGKRFFYLKVVGADGTGLGAPRAFLRSLFYPLSVIFWFISILTALFLRGRMIHDIIAGSRVVEEEP